MMAGIDPTIGVVLEVVMTMLLVGAVFLTAVGARAAKLGGADRALDRRRHPRRRPGHGRRDEPRPLVRPRSRFGRFHRRLVWIVGPVLGGIIGLL